MKKMIDLNNDDEWSNIKEESKGKNEIIIFKISPYCGTSYVCEQMFDEWFGRVDEKADIILLKIDVVGARKLSRKIAGEYKVVHESPQVIWIDKQGNVKWHQSHFMITEQALTGLLNK